MRISIFTPTHDPAFLGQVYNSIKDQPFHEWIVLCNNGAKYENADPRVRVIHDDTGSEYVGYLKWRCCQHATGDVFLELDHDDLLMPGCIEECQKAFQSNGTGFVYSNALHATADLGIAQRYSESWGWKFRANNFHGHALDEVVSFDPTPASVGRIWFAPNHFRAFRREAYQSVGGHSKQMRVLDDLDLMCRLYLATEFKHIDKGLYVYRIHGQNSWLKSNQEIQSNVLRIHDNYIEAMAEKWSDDRGLLKLELGGRMAARSGFTTVDLKDAEVIADLNQRWPFEDGSVGAVRSNDVFEHLNDSVHTMKELYRVLAPGGYAFIQVPSTDGRGAFQDPTHRSFWNENSFKYYCDARLAKYIDSPVRFQAMRCYTTEKNENQVCWTRAQLVKLTEGVRVPGVVNI